MAEAKFTPVQRLALWQAYRRKCFYCEEPLRWADLEIDHVIPEWLAKEPQKLAALLKECGIDKAFPNFRINDYCNLVPAHRVGCNARKAGEVPPRNMLMLFLVQVAGKRPYVLRELARVTKDQSMDALRAKLETMQARSEIEPEDLHALADELSRRRSVDDMLVVTLGVLIADLDEHPGLPHKELANLHYAHLCDWLEKDLDRRLRCLGTRLEYPEATARNGECLSLRVLFPDVRRNQVDRLDLARLLREAPWWQLLELEGYSAIYGGPHEP